MLFGARDERDIMRIAAHKVVGDRHPRERRCVDSIRVSEKWQHAHQLTLARRHLVLSDYELFALGHECFLQHVDLWE